MNKNYIADCLIGVSHFDADRIIEYEDFKLIFSVRHDMIHSIIAENIGAPNNEKPVGEIITEWKYPNDEQLLSILTQTPDMMWFEEGILKIIEITISVGIDTFQHKHSKYSLLKHVLRKNEIEFTFDVVVINPNYSETSIESLRKIGVSPKSIEDILRIVSNSVIMLKSVRSTKHGSSWFDVNVNKHEINYGPDDVIRTYRSHERKPFFDEEDLLDLKSTSQYDREDSKFMNQVYKEVFKMNSKLDEDEKFDEEWFIKELNKISTTNDSRPFMPIPRFRIVQIDSSIRSTEDDISGLRSFSAKMSNANDDLISTVGRRLSSYIKNLNPHDNNDFLFKCYLDEEQRYDMALDGPGRKRYINKGSIPHINAHLKNHMVSLSYNVDVEDIHNLSFEFSIKDKLSPTGDYLKDCDKISKMTGIGLNHVKVVQSIYREVNINCMRGDRRRKFICKQTGVKGVFVLLAPGSKLRCGQLVNLVWFKILVDPELCDVLDIGMSDPLFRSLNKTSSIWSSNWISTDANRLDHYIRCYDKILMAYLSIITFRFRSNKIKNASLIDYINNDDSNILGLIILIFLEDKRSTSKMLQNCRYLVMTSISFKTYYKSVFEKMVEPIRTPLQLYLLKRMVNYARKCQANKKIIKYKMGLNKYNTLTETILENSGGFSMLLPGPLSSNKQNRLLDFNEVLSEMYFTMLFNKNQDDPTHSSFQILKKMLESEENMQSVKQEGNHLGYRKDMSDIEWMRFVASKRVQHQFSARAIEIGAKLLRKKQGDLFNSEIIQSISHGNINKPISDYATYKASSVITNYTFNDRLKRQNARRRCNEGCQELLKKDKFDALSVANSNKDLRIEFQVFKKNQIGGVREILILDIESRIMINILETISRNICSKIPEEMLTHGRIKFDAYKSTLIKMKREQQKEIVMYYSFDKSRWGPGFVPIQFLYLFKPFQKEIGSFYWYIMDLLIRHTNKKCFFPDELMIQWLRDPNNVLKHNNDPALQRMKETFLKTKSTFFVNESNMGQGILHYTSSYLHAALISFRDHLYAKWCRDNGHDHKDHHDLYSSDDSFTIQRFKIDDIQKSREKMSAFLKCQEISERLFNCETSKSKSSINPFIGEFNSLFCSNLSFVPTTIKFALASVFPFNTDSFFKMVKESYMSCRQLYENGGSMELYYVAHLLNKNYCESIYHTHKGGQNDLFKYNLNMVPYQLGKYPIFDPTLMVTLGPEFHNFMIYKQKDKMNEEEKILFSNTHELSKKLDMNLLDDFESTEVALSSLKRIEASMGPVNQITRLRKNAMLKKDEIEQMIVKDPLILIRQPKTLEENIFHTCKKLFSFGSKEAMKIITSSIYYGRVSATVSADAFTISGESKTLKYSECVYELLKKKANWPTEEQMKVIYPMWDDYDRNISAILNVNSGRDRSIFESMSIKKYNIRMIETKLVNPVSKILSHFWAGEKIDPKDENKYHRDLDILKIKFPLFKDTLEETLDVLEGSKEERVSRLGYLLTKMCSLQDKVLKAVAYGDSGSNLQESIRNIKESNTSSMTAFNSVINISDVKSMNYDTIRSCYNYTVLKSYLTSTNPRSMNKVDYNLIRYFMMDPTVSKFEKKKILMVLLSSGVVTDFISWTKATSTIIHIWNVRQSRHGHEWKGKLDLSIISGEEFIRVTKDDGTPYSIMSDDLTMSPRKLFQLIKYASNVLGVRLPDLINSDEDHWVMDEKRQIVVRDIDVKGFKIEKCLRNFGHELPPYKLKVDEDMTKLMDEFDTLIYQVKTGLLETSTSGDFNDDDFEIGGSTFFRLVELGIMTKTYRFRTTTREDELKALVTIKVKKPKIRSIVRDKLNLKNTWDIKDDFPISEFDVKEMDDEADSGSDIDFLDIDDVDELKEQYNAVIKEDMTESNDDPWLSIIESKDDFITDLRSTLEAREEIIINANRRMLFHVLKFNVYAICNNLLDDMAINSYTIKMIITTLLSSKQDIGYALIDYYNQLIHNDNQTPTGYKVNFNPRFLNKFSIRLASDDFEFD